MLFFLRTIEIFFYAPNDGIKKIQNVKMKDSQNT